MPLAQSFRGVQYKAARHKTTALPCIRTHDVRGYTTRKILAGRVSLNKRHRSVPRYSRGGHALQVCVQAQIPARRVTYDKRAVSPVGSLPDKRRCMSGPTANTIKKRTSIRFGCSTRGMAYPSKLRTVLRLLEPTARDKH